MRHKNTEINFSDITPEIKNLSEICVDNCYIEKALYTIHNVNRGLRDKNGVGVLTGLTEISDVCGSEIVNGKKVSMDGYLRYRGIPIESLVDGFMEDNRFGFEEVTYLLLTGKLPNKQEFESFNSQIAKYRSLPPSFVRDIIMKSPSVDVMNTMARSVLTLYSYDENPDDISIANVLRQCIHLISIFPMIAVYGYQSSMHYNNGESLFIHSPKAELSTAENILHMLRPDSKYTKLEARILDLALVLHAEHGGGNNSSFTMHVVSSSGTDTYSAVAASLASLKGPKHGGANVKVVNMFEEIKENVKDWSDEEEVSRYLNKILDKDAFDRQGLIYGVGHGIYSSSDPRALIFKYFVGKLSEEKGLQDEFKLYETVERLAPGIIEGRVKTYKDICANIDFYSGFVYKMLGIPRELFTPLFAIARISGWSAHRIEELINASKIIRPAYMNVQPKREYIPIDKR
ncbi:citrate/2-methylcitrate synthase [Anaerofustis sp.]|uniref:citrate/2-methylcitrate synthase n=1 Tax=Anaerofustis sp. TaxID=1872517 RepID=UPI0025B9A7E6|nr:citrate/2-methylcitrate synthase [Anaerofustis sp.]